MRRVSFKDATYNRIGEDATNIDLDGTIETGKSSVHIINIESIREVNKYQRVRVYSVDETHLQNSIPLPWQPSHVIPLPWKPNETAHMVCDGSTTPMYVVQKLGNGGGEYDDDVVVEDAQYEVVRDEMMQRVLGETYNVIEIDTNNQLSEIITFVRKLRVRRNAILEDVIVLDFKH